MRIEPPESEPSAASARPAASAARGAGAGPSGRPVRSERIRDRAEVRVVARDAVGKLVQVRLADVHVPGGLEPSDRLGGAVGHVVGERIEPYVVRRPAVSKRSFTATGMPSSTRSGRARKIVTPATEAPIMQYAPVGRAVSIGRRCADASDLAPSMGADTISADAAALPL
jgi:hypothetical protein